MADTFQLEVATPERLLVDEQVSQAELPGEEGYMGILPGHAPLLSALQPGVVSYTASGGQHVLAIDGGFVEVFENHVRVLADHAEFASEIHLESSRRDLEQAMDELKRAHEAPASEAALTKMRKAQARIDAAERGSGGTQ